MTWTLEKQRIYNQTYYVAHREVNREEHLAKNRAFYKTNSKEILAKHKIWREAHKEKILADGVAYREANKEILRIRAKTFRENNIEKSRESSKVYYETNKEMVSTYKKRSNLKLKNEVFEAYGNKCICCGETEPHFLSIDHINGGGRKHLKEIGGNLYRWLRINNYPTGFQILCHNCNQAKGHYGVCPHQLKNGG